MRIGCGWDKIRMNGIRWCQHSQDIHTHINTHASTFTCHPTQQQLWYVYLFCFSVCTLPTPHNKHIHIQQDPQQFHPIHPMSTPILKRSHRRSIRHPLHTIPINQQHQPHFTNVFQTMILYAYLWNHLLYFYVV